MLAFSDRYQNIILTWHWEIDHKLCYIKNFALQNLKRTNINTKLFIIIFY